MSDPNEKAQNVSKRAKDELSLLDAELERLYALLDSDKHADWAKHRIEALQEVLGAKKVKAA